MAFRDSALLLAWIAIVLLAFGMSGLIRQMRVMANGMSVQPRRIGRGLPIPSGPGVEATVVLFAEAGCSACEAVAPEATRMASRLRAQGAPVDLLAVFSGSATEGWHGMQTLEERANWFDDAGVSMTPYFVAQSTSGVVLDAGPVRSHGHLKEVIHMTLESVANRKTHPYTNFGSGVDTRTER